MTQVNRPGARRLDPLPPGARDLLDGAAPRRRALTAELMAVFDAWGYEEVSVPNLEYYDVLRRGLSDDERRRSVRFVEGGSGKLVTLRADVTPQIARVVAQRLAPRRMDEHGRLPTGTAFRVSYAADVVRLPESARQRSEIHQVGVEYVGESEPTADAELVVMLHNALRSVGLEGFRIELAHRAVIRDALATLELDERLVGGGGPHDAPQHRGLAGHLARKDPRGLEEALTALGVDDARRQAFVALVDLFGSPRAVLDEAAERLRPLGVGRALARVEAVASLVAAIDPKAADALALDLGEVRGFDYYTGLRVRVWAPGVAEPVVRGGRYDEMSQRYGLDLPATGFAIDLDALERGLGGLEARTSSGRRVAHLFAHPTGADAEVRVAATQAAAAARREGGRRAWVVGAPDLAAAQAMATAAASERLTWFGATPESYQTTPQGWTRASQAPGEDEGS